METVSSDGNENLEKSLELKKLETYGLEIDPLRVRGKLSFYFTHANETKRTGGNAGTRFLEANWLLDGARSVENPFTDLF